MLRKAPLAPERSNEGASAAIPEPLQWLHDTASDCWNGATKLVSDHPYATTAAAVIGTAAAVALFKGGAGAVLEATTRGAQPALEVAGGESLARGLAQTEAAVARNIGSGLSPVWINGSEKIISSGGIISPGGIHLITTDLSGAGGLVGDAFPQVPKILVTDPIFRAGGLITNFEGNLNALYDTASTSVVRLQVTKAVGEKILAKTGSGYFNAEGNIVTAHHVIDGGDEITVFGKSFENGLKAHVKLEDLAHDRAELNLIDPPAEILRKVRPFSYRPASQLLKPSEQVVGFGYPNGVRTLQAMPGNFSEWKNIQLGPTEDLTGDAIRSFMEAGPGASGGAIVDAQGRLFGTIVQMQPNAHAAWSVPIPPFKSLSF
jgi:Trypsin-like peptidase domain